VDYLIAKRLIALSVAICFVTSAPLLLSPSTNANAQTQVLERYKITGAEGKLTGKILFEGEAPIKKEIDMSADANCAKIAKNSSTEDFIMTNGQLANTFVYVKSEELAQFAFDTPSAAVVVDQQKCQFTPRVLGVQTQQTLIFLNSDPTTHNVHPVPKLNAEWNRMQTEYGQPIEVRFMRAETLIPVKCNQHPWQRAFVGVLSHPFFDVSSIDGSFSIPGLPPGDYTLVAWHETRGERSLPISIEPGESKSVDVVFGMKTAGVPSHILEIGASVSIN
jgi:hypothetical protein